MTALRRSQSQIPFAKTLRSLRPNKRYEEYAASNYSGTTKEASHFGFTGVACPASTLANFVLLSPKALSSEGCSDTGFPNVVR
jgi:hypothetical protein